MGLLAVRGGDQVGDFESFSFELLRTFSVEPPFTEEEFLKLDPKDIVNQINTLVLDTYLRKEEIISKQAYPVIKDVYQRQKHVYENIVVPISDGTRVFQVVTNLEKATKSEGKELVKSYEKTVILSTIDEAWKEHLRELDELKQSVQSATYEQKDPLLIYKFESFGLFSNMVTRVNKEVIATLMKGQIPVADASEVKEARERRSLDTSNMKTSKTEVPSYANSSSTGGPDEQQKSQPIRVEKKVGRNDPCPCGSGKKFKQCHGRAGASPGGQIPAGK